jgi:hypothetical protein
VGRQALFVVILALKRLRGTLSEGMLFDIGYADGLRPVLAVPEAAVPNGTRQAQELQAKREQQRGERDDER